MLEAHKKKIINSPTHLPTKETAELVYFGKFNKGYLSLCVEPFFNYCQKLK